MAILSKSRGPRGSARPAHNRLWRAGMFFLSVIWFGSAASVGLGQTVSREYQIKAVFLYNFVQFTEWPTNSLAGTNAPIVIGILGNDPFGPLLDAAVRGEKKDGHAIQVQRYRRVEDIQVCHALFISSSETGRLAKTLAAVRGRDLLTVGESEAFAQNGGVVQFVTEKNKVRFQINVQAAKAANLTISSKLLRLAEIASSGKD